MPVDTRNKRASVLGLAQPSLLAPPAPDGTLGAPDRLHLAYLYAGIAAGAPVVVRPLIKQTVVMRRTHAQAALAVASRRTTARAVATHRTTVTGA